MVTLDGPTPRGPRLRGLTLQRNEFTCRLTMPVRSARSRTLSASMVDPPSGALLMSRTRRFLKEGPDLQGQDAQHQDSGGYAYPQGDEKGVAVKACQRVELVVEPRISVRTARQEVGVQDARGNEEHYRRGGGHQKGEEQSEYAIEAVYHRLSSLRGCSPGRGVGEQLRLTPSRGRGPLARGGPHRLLDPPGHLVGELDADDVDVNLLGHQAAYLQHPVGHVLPHLHHRLGDAVPVQHSDVDV